MRYALSLILGLIFGSFANVCILRLPGDQSLITPRSHCPQCGRALKVIQNIPVFSYLALRGRCGFCRARISWQYPLIEGVMAALFVFHAWFFKNDAQVIISDILGFYLICISVIDYRFRIIPDELSLSLAVLGLCGAFMNPYLEGAAWVKVLKSLGAGAAGGGFMFFMAYAGEKVFKKEALGGGDIKLIAASGTVLGWIGVIGPLLLGSLAGGGVALILLIGKKKRFGETLPFGPFLSLGIYVTCLFPDWWVPFMIPQ